MATHYSDNSGAAQDVMEHASFDISRKFANMCSLFRSFLDHYDRYFVHAHGKDSLHYKDWKQTLSEEYDSQDSYKLVYMMRNFIQHYDMPPLSISIHDSMAEEHFSTSVKLIESELKKDQKFFGKLSASFNADLHDLSLLTILDKRSESFARIVRFANGIRIHDAIPASMLIAGLRKELGIDDKGKLVITWFVKADGPVEKLNLTLEDLPEEKARILISETEN